MTCSLAVGSGWRNDESLRAKDDRGATKPTATRGGAVVVIAIGAAGLLLGGCANFSQDVGMTRVADQTGSILGKEAVKIRSEGDSVAAQARVASLLSKPLTADAAVQIALLNNRALQAAYNELGVSEAEMVEASLPPAPTFSLARLTGAELEVERQIVQNVLGLLTLPRRREIAEDRFRAVLFGTGLSAGRDTQRLRLFPGVRMANEGIHLVAEPVVREIAPGMKAHLWGYNGQSPGPTIEVVEGDKVRIFVTNKLPEHTTIHWHGLPIPNGMEGLGGLTQPQIKPGQTFVYEFQIPRSGTFMYHPHADEMLQMAMGMMGFFVVHPRDPKAHRVERDFVFLLNAYDIEPGAMCPKSTRCSMSDINTCETKLAA